ncbi:hypothetical protein [Weissella koreensis]|uniref:Uncharacterized protein n=1 Tax=Weissella koreensis TaxID=165096 RepID=A0A7H1MNF9_9LACO|nr:hypothetical protein [Weissella koreensis]AVH75793.1 hypothetical protein C4597_07210 [Weissella koreensis]QGN21014.1 hypothetical protein GKC51_07190 [Weissella koreensis]QNT64995.1 hypothetical protein FY536_06925 [Weissella koreensis]
MRKKVEIINSLDYLNYEGIKWQIENVVSGKSDELWIATPHENASNILANYGLNIKNNNVFDIYTNEYLKPISKKDGIWWTDLNVPNQAQLVVSDKWTKSLTSHGEKLAEIRWFNDGSRIVQAVIWLNENGEIDYKDIYRRDGSLFAKQYYSEGHILQSDFYDQNGVNISTSDFYFENDINMVLHNNTKYTNSNEFIKSLLSGKQGYEFNITQLGRELSFIPDESTLTFIDTIVDQDNSIKGNIYNLLDDDNHKIKRINLSTQNYHELQTRDLISNKITELK